MEDKEKAVREVIDRLFPYIASHGGLLSFSRLVDDIVYVNLGGACLNCSAIDETLKDGIEQIIVEEVPGITEVRLEENDYSL